MAINIKTAATVNGFTVDPVAVGTSDTQLLSNANASGFAYKINTLILTNLDSVAQACTVKYFTQAAGGGTGTEIVKSFSIPANSALSLLGGGRYIYLEENKSLYASAANASKIVAHLSGEKFTT